MIKFLSKFKIPTILGLGIILAGITAGVFLIVKDQVFFVKATPEVSLQNITVSNISESQVSISWQTTPNSKSFVAYGIKQTQEQTAFDDEDAKIPTERFLNYATIKNLAPETNFIYQIVSGKLRSEVSTFKTAKSSTFQNGFGPIIGTVFQGDNPITDGIAFLSISGASIQSAKIKSSGNFLIPVSSMKKGDLSDTFKPNQDDIAKLTISSNEGQASVLFKIKSEGTQLPPIKLGEDLDLTNQQPSPSPTPTFEELNAYDLNGDKQINSVDYSEVLLNFGKNPKNKKADINRDGVVDQKDLDLINKQINQ